jgi:hypothetical protein
VARSLLDAELGLAGARLEAGIREQFWPMAAIGCSQSPLHPEGDARRST